jgi:hypothetical protein
VIVAKTEDEIQIAVYAAKKITIKYYLEISVRQ